MSTNSENMGSLKRHKGGQEELMIGKPIVKELNQLFPMEND